MSTVGEGQCSAPTSPVPLVQASESSEASALVPARLAEGIRFTITAYLISDAADLQIALSFKHCRAMPDDLGPYLAKAFASANDV